MHKSATIFMIAPLIMLVSFASMNIFSNAMALKMNTDMNNEDYSQRYERFYQDESFKEDYYNYHKQLHQQEQQTDYNDYAYKDDRKISYNNNGYDNYDNDYSNYPIKDKIYECQTGQFEGFLVSSPELCDLEIPSGSPNVGQIPPENVYLAFGPINSTDTIDIITSSALCNPGDIAVGGGFVLSTGPNGFVNVNEMKSQPTVNDQEWLASAVGENIVISSQARCFDNSS